MPYCEIRYLRKPASTIPIQLNNFSELDAGNNNPDSTEGDGEKRSFCQVVAHGGMGINTIQDIHPNGSI